MILNSINLYCSLLFQLYLHVSCIRSGYNILCYIDLGAVLIYFKDISYAISHHYCYGLCFSSSICHEILLFKLVGSFLWLRSSYFGSAYNLLFPRHLVNGYYFIFVYRYFFALFQIHFFFSVFGLCFLAHSMGSRTGFYNLLLI